MFSTPSKREIVIFAMYNLSSANAFSLVMSKFYLFGKELILICMNVPSFTFTYLIKGLSFLSLLDYKIKNFSDLFNPLPDDQF